MALSRSVPRTRLPQEGPWAGQMLPRDPCPAVGKRDSCSKPRSGSLPSFCCKGFQDKDKGSNTEEIAWPREHKRHRELCA